MAEYKIEITARAKLDMREVHAYISSNLKEPNIAGRLLDKIETEILTLKSMPLRHAVERDEQLKLKNLRKLVVDSYLVFYTVNEKTETVFIVRVLYARRDWMTLL
ncbi:MAG: type II toxin-antitoxin system RelE/ParE family toxin [Synergistaceae bacterium]|nr:type II toxin-antitoxin system RelE/ParE family toxin [Synergistaceae bacterium]